MQRRTFQLGLAVLGLHGLDALADSGGWAAIEAGSGGRLGAAVLDTADGRCTGWRLDERFPMCSTFKWLLAAAVLARVDAGHDELAQRIVYDAQALPSYAPATRLHVGGQGMSVGELCDAAVTLSDNGAANLLLARLGGPSAVTAMARALGDTVTRLDRNEPTLNESLPGDPRDTTTPRAMAAALRRALLGEVLSAASRERLTGWLVETRTGLHRLRAGVPPGWRAGDKTGTGERGSTTDIAIVWPPGRAPLIVGAFLTASEAPIAEREAALAAVGRRAVTGEADSRN